MDALDYIYPVRCAQAYSATIVCVSVEVDERQRGIIIRMTRSAPSARAPTSKDSDNRL